MILAESNTNNNDIIDNLKDYPCAQNLVKQLPNLKNDIADMIRNTFINNDKMNIIFKPDSSLSGSTTDGATRSNSVTVGGITTYTHSIGLNTDVLKNATKEYILVTMYHETLHAFLNQEKARLGPEFSKKYPGFIMSPSRTDFVVQDSNHMTMANYITKLTETILSFNRSFDKGRAEALAKYGIFKLNPDEVKINLDEKDMSNGQFTGTKCP